MNNFITKYKDFVLLTIGTLLVVISIFLLSYDKVELLKSNLYDEIEMEKYKENNNSESEKLIKDEDIVVENVETNDVENQQVQEEKTESRHYIQREFIGI